MNAPLVVIGAGPAGEAAARLAARKKARVILIEKEYLGGLCLNRGCIPSKALLSIGKKISDLRRSPVLGSLPGLKVPLGKEIWPEMKKYKDSVILQLRASLEKNLPSIGVEVLRGSARFASPKKLAVDGQTVDFGKAVVSAGSAPLFPPPLDALRKELLDSDRVFELDALPKSLAIVGGGAVGCEFACLFHELGCKVTVIEKTPSLLPGEDPQIVNALRKSFEGRGIRILDSVTIQELHPKDGGWEASLSNGERLAAAKVMACVGRTPGADALGLDQAGIKYSRKGIEVDPRLRTSNADVYSAGDVTGLSLLAHAGSAQGEVAAANALGEDRTYEGRWVPRCLYTWPEVASVGLWTADLASRGIEGKAQRFFFQGSGRAIAEHDAEGFIQIVSDAQTDLILGAQIIGPHATELIHVIAVALKKEMTRKEMREVIFAHPTFSEGLRAALER